MSTNTTEARKNILYKLVSERYNLEIADAVRELLWVPDNISQASAQLRKAIAYIRDRQAMCRRSASMSIVGGALFAYHEAVVLPVSQLSKIAKLLAELETTEHIYDKAVSILQEMIGCCTESHITDAVALYQPVIPIRSESVEPTYEKTNGAWLLVQGVCGDSAAFVPAFFEFSDIGTLYPNALVFRTSSDAELHLKKCNRISVHTATITNGYTMCTQRYYARDHLHHRDLCNLNELLNNVKKKPVPLRCDDDIVDSDIVHGARFVNGTYELHAAPWRYVDAYDRFAGTWFRTEQELIDAIEYAVRNQEILYG